MSPTHFVSNRVTTIRFQRAKQTEDGRDMYLWYYVSESLHQWMIVEEREFQARNNNAFMYIDSEGKQEPIFTFVMKLIFIDHIIKYFRV